jgi:hypothetical protein
MIRGSIYTSRLYGHSPRGIDCVNIVPANSGRNVSVLVIIGQSGVIHKKIMVGPYNGILFCEFLQECQEMEIFENKLVIMDSVRFIKQLMFLCFLVKITIQ